MKRCFGLTQVCISHYLLIYLEYKVYVFEDGARWMKFRSPFLAQRKLSKFD